jgi:hypothetical protein
MKRWLLLALFTMPSLAMGEDLGVNNQQIVDKPPGDPSLIEQRAGPGSNDNMQSAAARSSVGVPNIAIQSTDGGGNMQTSLQTGGSGNAVIQKQAGSGNRQTVIQTGSGNRAIQTQSGRNRVETLHQYGNENGIERQD